MAKTSVSLDKWREFFRNLNSDIFDIIENGILVAASDYPCDFKLKRDRIAELLFTCNITKCVGCEKIELALPNADGVEKSDETKYRSGIETGENKNTKEIKYSYEDAEALTDEIEEESKIFEEISSIRKIIDNSKEETLLLDSLRKLQLMPMSVETLKATDIGKSVNSLRKHGSRDIRNLVKTLIDDWKTMVDEWVTATKAIPAEIETESVKTNVAKEEEGGLPTPPMDEGDLFATPTSMELSQFFDGMDDDGNPQKNRNNVRKPNLANIPKCKFDESPNDSSTEPKNRKVEPKKSQEAALLKHAPLCKPKPVVRPKATNNEIMVQKKTDRGIIQKKPIPPRPKLDCNDEAATRIRLETSKRKLHERYQEAQNAKKQRTIQLVEVQDLPKKNVFMQHQRNQTMMKSGNHIKNRAHNGRHYNIISN